MIKIHKATWFDAFNYCCSLGMNLITIFSLQKLQCIFDVLNDGIWFHYIISKCLKKNRFLIKNFTLKKRRMRGAWPTGRPDRTWTVPAGTAGAPATSPTLWSQIWCGSGRERLRAACTSSWTRTAATKPNWAPDNAAPKANSSARYFRFLPPFSYRFSVLNRCDRKPGEN